MVDHGRYFKLGIQPIHVVDKPGRVQQIVQDLDPLVEAILPIHQQLQPILVCVVDELLFQLVEEIAHKGRRRGVEEARVEGRVIDATELVLGEEDLGERVKHEELQMVNYMRV